MLTLGVDRDNGNPKKKKNYNEMDEAVLWMLEKQLKLVQKAELLAQFVAKHQAITPNLHKKLVDWGVTSVSIAPDVIDKPDTLFTWQNTKSI